MTKQDKIQVYLAEPIKIGDDIDVCGLNHNDRTQYTTVKVKDIRNNIPYFKRYYNSNELTAAIDYKKDTHKIGVNPFPEKAWNSQLRIVNFSLDSILHSIGFERNKRKLKATDINGTISIPELNWNPHITNSDGEEISYQRDFVWSVNDNQLLIESIYNNLDIGKIIVRKRSWKWIETRVNNNQIENTAFKDIVDGKQRLNAILEFVHDKFADLHGNYFSELSDKAHRTFYNFSAVAFGEIGESATDEDVKNIFLNINFTGRVMTQEHINFVKSIQV